MVEVIIPNKTENRPLSSELQGVLQNQAKMRKQYIKFLQQALLILRSINCIPVRLVISKELIMILEGILVYKLISHNTVSPWNIVIHICILGEGLATANRLTCGIWSE